MATPSTALANEAGRRKALERFGYANQPPQISQQELEREWSLLLPDFRMQGGAQMGALSALGETQRALALEHVLQRRALDRLMNACDAAHQRLAAGGMAQDLLDAYGAVRDEFEQAVEMFATHRDLVAEVLGGTATVAGA